MIVHVVLFEPRAGISTDEQARILDDLRRAATEIPSIRRFRIGRRITHGLPGYEQAMTENYEYAAIIEFEDREGLEAYLQHPAHEAAGRVFTNAASHALAYDYDVSELK